MSDELIRERDFYRAKVTDLSSRNKNLEFDNAELVKRDQDITKKLNDMSSRSSNNYRPRPRRTH
tara:strand:- start:535 stop:726 length:192 start_codon:yes stop_codon:yes gene_type:complete